MSWCSRWGHCIDKEEAFSNIDNVRSMVRGFSQAYLRYMAGGGCKSGLDCVVNGA